MPEYIGRRILLVEDEAVIAMSEKIALEKFGYAVRTVTTGEKAVEAVKTTADIDLILMDINLGNGIDGTQAAEIILKNRDIPIVFLSSHTDPAIVGKTEKITSYGYVVKSSSITVLDASIKMAFKLFDAAVRERAKEESLRQSDQKYKTLFNEMLDGFALHEIICNSAGDPVDYRFLDVNPVFERMTGLKAADIVGRTVLEVIPGTENYWIETYGNVALSGEPVVFENYASAIGKHFLVRAVRPAANHFACVFEDITERKNAEERLKASEVLLAETESIGKVGGWSFNIDTMELKWTDEVYRIHEVDIVPSTNVDAGINFYTRESRPIIEKAVKRAIEYGENYDLDLEIITAKGNKRAVHTIGKADLKNRRIYGFFQDITERKQIEGELRRFESISDNAIYGNAIADLQGNLIYVNRFFAVIHGYEPDELIGKHFSVFHKEHQMDAAGNLVASMLQEGAFTQATVWHSHRDGTEFPMLMSGTLIKDDYGNPQYLAASAVDITDREKAEEALVRKSKLLEKTQMLAAIGSWEWDIVHDTWYFSEQWKKIHGVSKSEFDSSRLFEIAHPEDAPHIGKAFSDAKEQGKPYDIEHRIIRADNGETRYIKALGEVEFDQNTGCPVRMLGAAQDITERRKAEDEIRKQLSEKEILLREVHHRVKNNIANIQSLLSLQAGSAEDAEVKAALQEAISRVQSLRVLYDKLLLSETVNEVSMKNYVEGLIDSLALVYNSSNGIIIDRHIEDFRIDMKKAFLVGIIINELLTNVFKYAFTNRDQGMVSICIDKQEGNVTLVIKDNGSGFDETALENKSPGFGRTIVRMLAEQLDGTYSSGNEDGAKSVVRFGV